MNKIFCPRLLLILAIAPPPLPQSSPGGGPRLLPAGPGWLLWPVWLGGLRPGRGRSSRCPAERPLNGAWARVGGASLHGALVPGPPSLAAPVCASVCLGPGKRRLRAGCSVFLPGLRCQGTAVSAKNNLIFRCHQPSCERRGLFFGPRAGSDALGLTLWEEGRWGPALQTQSRGGRGHPQAETPVGTWRPRLILRLGSRLGGSLGEAPGRGSSRASCPWSPHAWHRCDSPSLSCQERAGPVFI